MPEGPMAMSYTYPLDLFSFDPFRAPTRLAALAAVLLILMAPGLISAQAVDLPATHGGAALTNQSLGSGTTVMVFWASWSPKCRDIEERTARLAQRWGSKAKVVLVNFQEDSAAVKDFLGPDAAVPSYLDRDGAFAKRHSVLNLPGLLVVKDGRSLYEGRLPTDADQLLGSLLS